MYPDNNILTYLKWRGDVDFSTSPFNDIDALVLSIFSYLELPGIVKSNGTTISLEKAAKLYFADDHPRYDNLQYQELFKLMAHADRFKNAKLSYFISTLTEHTQFSAIKIELTDGTNFIAFRGTDDSLIGWKEDFEISFKITVAQQQAVKLLETILKADDQDYYLGGHSKGGNLAEYAAINIEPKLRKRIKRIYTLDSTGIAEEVGAQLPNKYLQNTLRRFVPDFSVIGRLFESKNIPATIVGSTRKGLSQHDAFSWQIIGSNFDTRRHRNAQSQVYNQLINQWIGNATLEERESLTNDLFSALSSSGATKINELDKNGFGGFGAILFSLADSSRRTRFVFGSLFSSIWQTIKSQQLTKALFSTDTIVGWVLVVFGIISLTLPQYAVRAFGALVAFTGIGFSVHQILTTAKSSLKDRQKNFFIISYLVVFALSTALISNNRLLIFLAHYFLGLFLIIYSYIRIRQLVFRKLPGIFQITIVAIEALIAFALGIIVVVNPSAFNRRAIIIIGILLIAYGFFKLVGELFGQRSKMPKNHR